MGEHEQRGAIRLANGLWIDADEHHVEVSFDGKRWQILASDDRETRILASLLAAMTVPRAR